MGKVYCLWAPNSEDIELVKIGYTSMSNPVERAKQVTYAYASINSNNTFWQVAFYLDVEEDGDMEYTIHKVVEDFGFERVSYNNTVSPSYQKQGRSEFFRMNIHQAYFLFQAIGRMFGYKFQVCKIQIDGYELDEGMDQLEKFHNSICCSSAFLRTQYCGFLPKGHVNMNLTSYQ